MWYADGRFYKCLSDFLQWLQRTVQWGCAAAGVMLMFLRAAPDDISSVIVFSLCYHSTLLMRCMFYSYSDPYTKLSLYDPASGEITSLQTKTIKKVSQRVCSQFLFLFLKLFFTIFFSPCFLTQRHWTLNGMKNSFSKWVNHKIKISCAHIGMHLLSYLLMWDYINPVFLSILHFRLIPESIACCLRCLMKTVW